MDNVNENTNQASDFEEDVCKQCGNELDTDNPDYEYCSECLGVRAYERYEHYKDCQENR